MSKKEDTPIVIDFKRRNQVNYGSNHSIATNATPSGQNNNNNNRGIRHPTPSVDTPSTLYCLHGHKNIEVRDHCHRQRSEGVDVKARKKLLIASALCLIFMIAEIIGGLLSNSLAIATDAAHLLTDFASFMISLFAIWIAGRPSTKRMSFGWYRAEVIGALASVVMIWFITAILVWLAIERVISQDFEVEADIMLITSGLAILVNLIMGFQLHHGHSHGGHSHAPETKRPTSLPDPKSLIIIQPPKPTKFSAKQSDTAVNADDGASTPTSTRICRSGETLSEASENKICPMSPTERIEDGVTNDEAVDAELPTAGLATYSYQNSRSVSEVHAEIAAVMAETAPGQHHHGGVAAKEAVNMNVRAAFIHVIGDMVQSVGVFLAALVIYFKPEWKIADPICTFIFSVIVLFTTFSILKDALLVLMEGTPSYMHYTEVMNIFLDIEGVERVHNLRIWALSINKVALSVHLAIRPGANPKMILERATTAVHMRYNFFETTIQIEEFTPEMENCVQCVVPEN